MSNYVFSLVQADFQVFSNKSDLDQNFDYSDNDFVSFVVKGLLSLAYTVVSFDLIRKSLATFCLFDVLVVIH